MGIEWAIEMKRRSLCSRETPTISGRHAAKIVGMDDSLTSALTEKVLPRLSQRRWMAERDFRRIFSNRRIDRLQPGLGFLKEWTQNRWNRNTDLCKANRWFPKSLKTHKLQINDKNASSITKTSFFSLKHHLYHEKLKAQKNNKRELPYWTRHRSESSEWRNHCQTKLQNGQK